MNVPKQSLARWNAVEDMKENKIIRDAERYVNYDNITIEANIFIKQSIYFGYFINLDPPC